MVIQPAFRNELQMNSANIRKFGIAKTFKLFSFLFTDINWHFTEISSAISKSIEEWCTIIVNYFLNKSEKGLCAFDDGGIDYEDYLMHYDFLGELRTIILDEPLS